MYRVNLCILLIYRLNKIKLKSMIETYQSLFENRSAKLYAA